MCIRDSIVALVAKRGEQAEGLVNPVVAAIVQHPRDVAEAHLKFLARRDARFEKCCQLAQFAEMCIRDRCKRHPDAREKMLSALLNREQYGLWTKV